MGYNHVRQGEDIRLRLNLHDAATNRFPQAVVKNEAGTPISGSPFTMAHLGDGEYGVDIAGKANGNYRATYKTYLEIGHTTFLPLYGVAEDTVEIDNVIGRVDQNGVDIGQVAGDGLSIADVQTAMNNNGYNPTRAANLDNLDVTVSSRESESSAAARAIINQGEHDSTQSGIGSLENISIADVEGAFDSKGYTAARAPGLDNLDATISSRQSEANASSRNTANQASHTQSQADIAALENISEADVQSAMTAQGYTPARAPKLDNADTLVSSRQSESDAASRNVTNLTQHGNTQTAVGNLNDIDEAGVQSAMTAQGYTSPRAGNLDNVDVATSTRESEANALTRATTSQNEHDATQVAIGNLNDLDESEIQAALTAQGYTGSRAVKLDNLDTTITSRSSQTSVDNLQNNSTFQATIPQAIQKPDAGNITTRVFVRLFDASGNPVDPSASNVMNIEVEEQNGTNKVPVTAMTRTGVGAFQYDLVLAFDDNLGQYICFFTYDIASSGIEQVKSFQFAESVATIDMVNDGVNDLKTTIGTPVLATIADDINSREAESAALARQNADLAQHTVTQNAVGNLNDLDKQDIKDSLDEHGYTSARATTIDNADVATSTRQSTSDAVTKQAALLVEHNQTQADITALENLSKQDVKDSMSEHGYTAARGPKLDNLDATVASRQSEADALSRHNTSVAKHNSTQSDIGALENLSKTDVKDSMTEQGYDPARAVKIDNLDTTVGSRESESDANSRAVADAANHVTTRNLIGNESITVPDIVDAVWDENLTGHQAAETAGNALSKARDGADPEIVATNVWSRPAASHVAPETMGGKLNESRNQTYQNTTEIGKVNTKLTPIRAQKLDLLDDTISSRQSQSDADAKHGVVIADISAVKTVVDGISLVVGLPDPDNQSILSLLTNSTYGLANLRIAIDSRASLSKQVGMEQVLDNTFDILTDGAIGLAILRAKLDETLAELADGNYGLPRLRTELDNKPNSNEINYPEAVEIRDAVWAKLTSNSSTAGSFGELVKNYLNASVSSRSTQSSVDVVDSVVDSIKVLLESGTFGLAQLLSEINDNEAKLDTVLVNLGTHNGNLSTARADILAAIGVIVDGTPTIIAALDVMKGGGFAPARDTLEQIGTALQAGTATLVKQNTIISKIDSMQTQNDSVETKVEQNKDEILANRTQIIDKVDAVQATSDTIDSKSDSTLTRLDDSNFGLSKAKIDRDNHKAEVVSAVGAVSSKTDTIDSKVDALDTKSDSDTVAILAAIDAIDLSTTNSKLDGVIALLQNGSYGLSPIRQAISNLAAQENAHHNATGSSLSAIDTKVDSLGGLILAMQGAGFSASDSLVVIKAAIQTVISDLGDKALKTDIEGVLIELENIKDGGTTTFDGATDSLKVIAEKDAALDGLCGGPA